MRGKTLPLLAAAAILLFTTRSAWGAPGLDSLLPPDELIEALSSKGCWQAQATFRVSLPQNADDVVYDVGLRQTASAGDSLLACGYVIEWTYRRDNPVSGFSAYFNGNHYRYRGQGRLQEYHRDWDSSAFGVREAGGRKIRGVERSAQFADLLPAVMADELRDMVSDSMCVVRADVTRDGHRRLTAEQRHGGETVMRRIYIFDDAGNPLRITTESNIGQLSEQTVDVVFAINETPDCTAVTEDGLIERWPDVFGNFRNSNFRIENLRGKALPQIALPLADGTGRYVHHVDEGFQRPVFVLLLDPSQGFTAATLEDVRSGIDEATAPADIVAAWTGTSADAVAKMEGSRRSGETHLLNADAYARDCGAATLPAIIVCDRRGRVINVVTGYNPDLKSIVISSIETLNE